MQDASGTGGTADVLMADPILGRLPGIQLSALLPHVSRRTLTPGEALFQSGDPADTLFLIVSGAIRLEGAEGQRTTRTEGYAAEESLLGIDRHNGAAFAETAAEVLVIPAPALASQTQAIRAPMFKSYVSRHATTPLDTAKPLSKLIPGPESAAAIIGWLLAMALPFAVLYSGPALGLSPAATDFLTIIAVTVCMWLFGLVPEYVPPLFAALAVILLDVAPAEVALSGFRSESFFMCLSVFGLGALMVSSGVTTRFTLWVLGRVPATPFGYNISLFGISALLSPIIPSVLGRVIIVSPFMLDLIEVSKAQDKDLFANRLIYSLTFGASLLVPLFLTASVPNLVIYGLFDPQTQFAFDWLSWLYAASVFGLLVLVSFALVSALLFRGARDFRIPRATITEQRRLLGPMSGAEWAAVLAVLAMVGGILTEPLHRIDVPWIALAILVTLMLFGSLQRDAIRSGIDWPILIYIGTIVGWVPIAHRTGLDAVIVQNLTWLGSYMTDDFALFILLVSGLILLVRLALPTGVTVVLFATALFPLAASEGLSLWLIGFIILAVADTFIFPYQSSYFLKLQNDLAARGLAQVCDTRRIITANIIMIGFRIGAIYGSLAFWAYLGLI